MYVIGLTGGIASGKSTVATVLADQGLPVIDADGIGHEVLLQEPVCRAIVARWGSEVVRPDGCLDRTAIADRVFAHGPSGQKALAFLEQLIHPLIEQELTRRLDQLGHLPGSAAPPAVVLDAAILFKTGWNQRCDCVVFVDTPRDERLRRAAGRNWTPEQFARREATQMPVEWKKRQSDVVLDNSGDLQQLHDQVTRWWESTKLA